MDAKIASHGRGSGRYSREPSIAHKEQDPAVSDRQAVLEKERRMRAATEQRRREASARQQALSEAEQLRIEQSLKEQRDRKAAYVSYLRKQLTIGKPGVPLTAERGIEGTQRVRDSTVVSVVSHAVVGPRIVRVSRVHGRAPAPAPAPGPGPSEASSAVHAAAAPQVGSRVSPLTVGAGNSTSGNAPGDVIALGLGLEQAGLRVARGADLERPVTRAGLTTSNAAPGASHHYHHHLRSASSSAMLSLATSAVSAPQGEASLLSSAVPATAVTANQGLPVSQPLSDLLLSRISNPSTPEQESGRQAVAATLAASPVRPATQAGPSSTSVAGTTAVGSTDVHQLRASDIPIASASSLNKSEPWALTTDHTPSALYDSLDLSVSLSRAADARARRDNNRHFADAHRNSSEAPGGRPTTQTRSSRGGLEDSLQQPTPPNAMFSILTEEPGDITIQRLNSTDSERNVLQAGQSSNNGDAAATGKRKEPWSASELRTLLPPPAYTTSTDVQRSHRAPSPIQLAGSFRSQPASVGRSVVNDEPISAQLLPTAASGGTRLPVLRKRVTGHHHHANGHHGSAQAVPSESRQQLDATQADATKITSSAEPDATINVRSSTTTPPRRSENETTVAASKGAKAARQMVPISPLRSPPKGSRSSAHDAVTSNPASIEHNSASVAHSPITNRVHESLVPSTAVSQPQARQGDTTSVAPAHPALPPRGRQRHPVHLNGPAARDPSAAGGVPIGGRQGGSTGGGGSVSRASSESREPGSAPLGSGGVVVPNAPWGRGLITADEAARVGLRQKQRQWEAQRRARSQSRSRVPSRSRSKSAGIASRVSHRFDNGSGAADSHTHHVDADDAGIPDWRKLEPLPLRPRTVARPVATPRRRHRRRRVRSPHRFAHEAGVREPEVLDDEVQQETSLDMLNLTAEEWRLRRSLARLDERVAARLAKLKSIGGAARDVNRLGTNSLVTAAAGGIASAVPGQLQAPTQRAAPIDAPNKQWSLAEAIAHTRDIVSRSSARVGRRHGPHDDSGAGGSGQTGPRGSDSNHTQAQRDRDAMEAAASHAGGGGFEAGGSEGSGAAAQPSPWKPQHPGRDIKRRGGRSRDHHLADSIDTAELLSDASTHEGASSISGDSGGSEGSRSSYFDSGHRGASSRSKKAGSRIAPAHFPVKPGAGGIGNAKGPGVRQVRVRHRPTVVRLPDSSDLDLEAPAAQADSNNALARGAHRRTRTAPTVALLRQVASTCE